MDNSINKNIDKNSANRLEEIILLIIAFVGLLSLVIYWR
jgi:hypothetical protein